MWIYFCWSTHLVIDTWVVSRSLLLWVRLPLMCLCKSFFVDVCFIYFGWIPGVELLGHRVDRRMMKNISIGKLVHSARELYGHNRVTSSGAHVGLSFLWVFFSFRTLWLTESSCCQPFVYFSTFIKCLPRISQGSGWFMNLELFLMQWPLTYLCSFFFFKGLKCCRGITTLLKSSVNPK